MFEKRRGHFLILFDKIISEMIPIFLILIPMFIFGMRSEGFFSNPLVLVGFLFLTMLSRVLSYGFTTFELTPEIFYVRSGIINKKVMEIPVESVTSVNFSQNVLFQIMNVFLIKVDTVSSVSLSAPAFAFRKNEALEFQSLLVANRNRKMSVSSQSNEISSGVSNSTANISFSPHENGIELDVNSGIKTYTPQDSSYIEQKAPIKSIIILGILEKKIQYIFLPLMPLLYLLQLIPDLFVDFIDQMFASEQVDEYAEFVSDLDLQGISWYVFLIAFIIIVGIFIAFYLVSVVASIVTFLVKYANFTIKKSDKSLQIEYGLLNKKVITLSNKKISGVALRQSMMMRIFGYYTVEALVSGYGDTQNEFKVILFPIGKKADIEQIMSFAIPDVKLESEYTRQKEGTLRYFFYNFASIFSVGLLGTSLWLYINDPINILYSVFIILSMLVCIAHIVSCILKYKMEKMSLGKETISFIKGGFSCRTVFLKVFRTETVSYNTSIFKKKRGIGNIGIQYFGPVGRNEFRIKNYRESDYLSIRANLLY